jgi:hypothetical protein
MLARIWSALLAQVWDGHCRRAEAEFCRAEFLGARILVSTVGRDEALVRAYIRTQEEEDKRLDPLNMMALKQPPSGGQQCRGRVSDPAQPL